jgi:hypothetical protein
MMFSTFVSYFHAYLLGALLMAMFVRWTLHAHDGVRALFADAPRPDLVVWILPIVFGLLWPLVLVIVITEIAS